MNQCISGTADSLLVGDRLISLSNIFCANNIDHGLSNPSVIRLCSARSLGRNLSNGGNGIGNAGDGGKNDDDAIGGRRGINDNIHFEVITDPYSSRLSNIVEVQRVLAIGKEMLEKGITEALH